MSDDLICKESVPKNIKKIKASVAEIMIDYTIDGTKEKPYYKIVYFDLSDNEFHVGFGTYSPDIVREYLKAHFEIVDWRDRDLWLRIMPAT